VDRAIGGRWSIAVIAFALIGIVTLQLGLLKLNVGVGRSLERERTLERENATLGIENAELASPERIRQLASRLGMSSVALTQLRFLRASHGDGAAAGAAARLHSPAHPAVHTSTEASSSEASGGEASSSGASGAEAARSEASSGETSSGEAASAEAPSAEASSSSVGESQTATAGGGEAESSSGGSPETGPGG
jgi:cell division protein FtsL